MRVLAEREFVKCDLPVHGLVVARVTLRTFGFWMTPVQIIARVQTAASEGNFPRTPDKARAFIRNSARSKLWDRYSFCLPVWR